MNTHYIGRNFPTDVEYGAIEKYTIDTLLRQIKKNFTSQNNLLVNTTWLDQIENFDNVDLIKEYHEFVKANKIDNLFILAAADPTTVNRQKIAEMQSSANTENLFLIGHYDNTPHQWNWHTILLLRYWKHYDVSELILKKCDHIFLNYNRKNRHHRTALVKEFMQHNLMEDGIVTLGRNPNNPHSLYFEIGDKIEDFKQTGHWDYLGDDHGIPHDLYSLGNFACWQSHFLTITSEAIFDNNAETFISEKTWKPILGLRPFLMNGQTKIYDYLRNKGFKTFAHYFPVDNIESPDTVHQKIIEVLQYLKNLSEDEILSLYNTMLPDLLYNRERFFEFAREEKYRIDHMFD